MASAFRSDDPDAMKKQSGTVAKDKRVLCSTSSYIQDSLLGGFRKGCFPGTMQLVTGHAALYAWFLALHQALESSDVECVAPFWQAGFTVAIQAHMTWSRTTETLRCCSCRATAT